MQRKSQLSYDSIQTVSFKGYSKTYIYFGYSPLDVNIVPEMTEYYFDGFWMKPDSLRLIIKAFRSVQEDSMDQSLDQSFPLPNPFHFIYDPSALGIGQEADADSGDFSWPVYPFAQGADSLYTYRLENEIEFGDNRVFLIHVQPRYSTVPGVIGLFTVDALRHEVVASNFMLNEAASVFEQVADREGRLFRTFIKGTHNHRIVTEKELFYGSYWLPTTMEEEFIIRLWGMDVRIHRIIEFESYRVNPAQPDPDLQDEKIAYRIDEELEKTLFDTTAIRFRLSKEEEERIIGDIKDRLAASSILPDLLASESFSVDAVQGFLDRSFRKHLEFAQSLGDWFLYNRVEGLRIHRNATLSEWPFPGVAFSVLAGYGLSDHRWKGEASGLFYFTKQKHIFMEVNGYATTGFEEDRQRFSRKKNTFTSLVYKGDYHDYIYRQGGQVGLGYRFLDQAALKLSLVLQDEQTASVNTEFSIFRGGKPFRANPAILEGKHHGFHADLLIQSHWLRGKIHAEHSSRNLLKSDFSYSLLIADFSIQSRVTYYSDLRIRLSGGNAWGSLPPQRWFDFGGRSFLNYYGNLRGIGYKTFTGDRMFFTTVEYAVKGGAIAGLLDWGLLKALKCTLWYGAGWSTLSDANRALAETLELPYNNAESGYHEIGIGLGDVLNIFRFDVIWTNRMADRLLFRLNLLQ